MPVQEHEIYPLAMSPITTFEVFAHAREHLVDCRLRREGDVRAAEILPHRRMFEEGGLGLALPHRRLDDDETRGVETRADLFVRRVLHRVRCRYVEARGEVRHIREGARCVP